MGCFSFRKFLALLTHSAYWKGDKGRKLENDPSYPFPQPRSLNPCSARTFSAPPLSFFSRNLLFFIFPSFISPFTGPFSAVFHSEVLCYIDRCPETELLDTSVYFHRNSGITHSGNACNTLLKYEGCCL